MRSFCWQHKREPTPCTNRHAYMVLAKTKLNLDTAPGAVAAAAAANAAAAHVFAACGTIHEGDPTGCIL